MSTLKIITVNVRGLRDRTKRATVFAHLASIKFSLCLLQEVHLKDDNDVSLFSREWVKGDSRWSIGGVHSTGVGVLCGDGETRIVGSFSVVQGRVLVLDIEWRGRSLRVVNVYANVESKRRNELFENLDTVFMTNSQVILGGDFNTSREGNAASTALATLITRYQLVDAYRKVYPGDPGFTWTNSRGAASRIDYVFCPAQLMVTSAHISPVFYTDHNMLTVEVNLMVAPFGKGYWKLNNQILADIQFRASFRCFFRGCKELASFYPEVTEWWESTKERIKHFIQKYTREKKRKEFKEYYQVQREVEKMFVRGNINNTIDYEELKHLQYKQQLFFQKRAEAFKFRSLKEKWEKEERCSAYFFKHTKSKAVKRCISSLLDGGGEEVRDTKGMLGIATAHFSEFFCEGEVDREGGTNMLSNIDHVVPTDMKELLEREVGMDEVYRALTSMKDGKVPGIDGLTKEFYFVFWDILGTVLLELFRFICEKGQMGKSMCEGVISLLHKKGDKRVLSNYRPLTMLCVDYKIFSKVLTTRLGSALPHIIGADQTCSVAGRQISFNTQLHRDVQAYARERNLSFILLSLDQEKAFDRVNHVFMFRILEKFGYGKRFLSWLNILYNNAGSRVNVNGHLGEIFKQARGVRQGCPCSALLYVAFIEVLACAIRKNKNIRGVMLPGGESLTMSLYADDTVLYLENDWSLKEAMTVIDAFSCASGAKVNKGKSQVKYVGKWSDRGEAPCDLALCRGPITILGISYGNNDDAATNWETRLTKVTAKLNLWGLRRLTVSGKVLAIKADILPSLLHLALVFPMPALIGLKLHKAMFGFVWGGYEYLKRDLMYQPVERGGRDLPNLVLKLRVLFYTCICKLLVSPCKHKCQALLKFWLMIPLRPAVGVWDNLFPKAEQTPTYLTTMVRWAKKHRECMDKEFALEHKKLYVKLVEKMDPKESRHMPREVWKRVQDKELENRLKDFNWLALHKRLAVRNTLYNHGLTANKWCPRADCNGVETIEHVLWECLFAQQVWRELVKMFSVLKGISWIKTQEMGFNLEKGQLGKVILLVSIIRAKLWEVRCSEVNSNTRWTVAGVVKNVKGNLQKQFRLEVDKWGVDSIKSKWKALYTNIDG